MAPDEYASAGGGGKLKLKGSKVSEGRVEKKKKMKDKGKDKEKEKEKAQKNRDEGEVEATPDWKQTKEEMNEEDGSTAPAVAEMPKTEAERRYEEVRRKRLHERLQREGSKTHKERVEELNKYLSRLSEHHDMPKIGPG